ncbi:hypothetical protein ABLO26_11355 [Neobacillus sp. 179-J 1A1 HS]
MTYTKNNLGIIFSYHGLSGPGWRNAEGLVKKIFLSEDVQIIDFNINDFILIAEGVSFIKLINDKRFALESDTSFKQLIEAHPNQSKFETFSSSN